MHPLLGEVAPLAPLLIPIGEILVWAVALAFCLLVVYIARALFGTAESAVGWIPWFGKVAQKSLTSIEQKIVSQMSRAASSADAKVGAAFHQLARLVDWLGHEIAAHANILATLAQLVLGQNLAELVQSLIRQWTRQLHAAQATATHALRHSIAAGKAIERGIGADVLPRVRTAEREIGQVIGRDLPAIRAGEATLQRDVTGLWKWVRAHPLAAGSAAFAGAVGYALSRIGAGWIRCSNWRNAGRTVCGLDPAYIDSILADALVIAGSISIVELAKECQAITGVTETAVRGFIREF